MGTLYIVSTPIGNLEDITIRAIRTLFSVDIIACEDTRRTGLLMHELHGRYAQMLNTSMYRYIEVNDQKLMSYYEESEDKRIPEIIELLASGKNVALVSDAGTPLISDPGFRLVRECLKRSIPVISIPGASAVLTALTSSGLPSDSFLFLGYPPEKQSHRIKLFESLVHLNRFKCISTYIMYCAPHKLVSALTDMKEIFGDMDITLTRELTKVHEQIWQGTISQALSEFKEPKGEFVLLFTLSSHVHENEMFSS